MSPSIRQHAVADVVVRVHQVARTVEAGDLGVGGASLDVGDRALGAREHVVVARRAVGAQRHRHHLVQRSRPHHLEHLMRARDAQPLVVRRELVAGERQPGRVPPDAQPRHPAELEDRRIVADAPLDADDAVLHRRAQVVVVPDEQVPVGRRRRSRNDVAAPPSGRPRRAARTRAPRSRPRTGRAGSTPAASAMPSSSVDEPRQPWSGERAVLLGQSALVRRSCALRAGRRTGAAISARTRSLAASPSCRPASRWFGAATRMISMRGGGLTTSAPRRARRTRRRRRRRRPVSAGTEHVGPAPTIASQTPRFAR